MVLSCTEIYFLGMIGWYTCRYIMQHQLHVYHYVIIRYNFTIKLNHFMHKMSKSLSTISLICQNSTYSLWYNDSPWYIWIIPLLTKIILKFCTLELWNMDTILILYSAWLLTFWNLFIGCYPGNSGNSIHHLPIPRHSVIWESLQVCYSGRTHKKSVKVIHC